MLNGDLNTEKVTADFEELFRQAMEELIGESVDIDPFAIFTLHRIKLYGGLKAAKSILATSGQQTGLMRLWQEGRLDISLEALVLQQPYKLLFTEKELDTARERLKELDYTVE